MGTGCFLPGGSVPVLPPQTWTWQLASLPNPRLPPARGKARSFSGELVLVGMRTGTSFKVKLVTATVGALVQCPPSLSSPLGFLPSRCQPACQVLEAFWEVCELMGGVLMGGGSLVTPRIPLGPVLGGDRASAGAEPQPERGRKTSGHISPVPKSSQALWPDTLIQQRPCHACV